MTSALVLAPAGAAQLITNGGFETGTFAGWTALSQAGSDGSLNIDTPGTTTPISGTTTSASGGLPHGSFYAVTDQGGPGAYSLLQSFVVAPGATSVVLSYDLFVNNYGIDGVQINPAGLDYTATPNEHARVDLLTNTALPFSTSTGVLQNLYIGADAGATPNPFTHYSFDITSLVGAGGTFQIRFAEADNEGFFNVGVDNVSVIATNGTAVVPEPQSVALLGLGVAALALARRRRRGAR